LFHSALASNGAAIGVTELAGAFHCSSFPSVFLWTLDQVLVDDRLAMALLFCSICVLCGFVGGLDWFIDVFLIVHSYFCSTLLHFNTGNKVQLKVILSKICILQNLITLGSVLWI
jgi:hypothetical protein